MCAKHILSHRVSVNDGSFHPACLKCSVCDAKLTQFICQSGFLRCSKHATDEVPKIKCDVCAKYVDDQSNVVLTVGKKIHPACFNCSVCAKKLDKKTAHLLGDKLSCVDCLVKSGESHGAKPPVTALESSNNIAMSPTSSSSSIANTGAALGAVVSQMPQGDTFVAVPFGEHKFIRKKINWKLDRHQLIGKGSFGKVYLARNEDTGELIAVKQVVLSTTEEKQQAKELATEIDLLENLRHPNIVTLLGTERTGDTLNILMEYVPGNSLDTMLERFGAFSEQVIRSYINQILKALAYCHKNHVVHRDIKGKNILVDSHGHVKLADFGSAKRFSNVLSKDSPSLSYNYTPLYTAPEVVVVGDYNSKVDVWGVGCVIIEMASGKPPWSEKKFPNHFRALYYIGNSDSLPAIPEMLSPLGVEFIKLCLRRDPDKRPAADELLQHQWLKGLGI
jgi:predicted Ser/Thr protein kinase